jgi:type II secretory pathway component PulK
MKTKRNLCARSARQRRRSNGLSLVELVVAVAVIAFGVVTLMAQIEAAYRATNTSRETNKATAHLQAGMEKIISTPFNDIVSTFPDDSSIDMSNLEPIDMMDGEYLTVSYEDASADPLVITVTVYWTSFDGRSLSRSLTTMRTK